MTRSLLMLLGLGVVSSVYAAERPVSPAQPPSIARLVEQLGDRSNRVREQASQALEALGSAALPPLHKARDAADPEVRRRIDTLIDVLGKAHLLEPKRVSLKLDKRPLREAVVELSRQTGYAINLYPNGGADERDKQRCSLDFRNLPFWDALDLICTEGGMVLQRGYGEEQKLHLRPGDEFTPYVAHAGAFRLAAQGFQYNRSIDFGTLSRTAVADGQRSEQLTFRFTIMSEPRLPLLWVGAVTLTEAVDDRGNSMLLPESDANNFDRRSYIDRGFFQDVWVALQRSSREAQTAKRLRGLLPVRVLVEQKPELVVENILKAKGKQFKSERTELTVEEVKQDAGTKRYEVKFTVRNLQGNGDLNFYSSVRHRFELSDAKGAKYTWSGGGWGGNDNSVRGTFTFAQPAGDAGPPAKLTFYGWTTLYHQVVFEFKDLPLP